MTAGAHIVERGQHAADRTATRRRRHSLTARAIWMSHRLWTVAAAAALIGLISHLLYLPLLYRPLPSGSAMHPVTALAVLLLCLSNWLDDSGGRKRIALVAAVGVVAITVARLVQPQPALPLFSFEILEATRWGALERLVSFGANSAAGLLACALATLLLQRRRPGTAQVLALLALVPALVSVTGYAFQLSDFHGEMSPLTTVAMLAIASAIVGRTARHGAIRALLSPSHTGRIMRILLSTLAGVLPVFGLIVPRIVLGPGVTKLLAVNLVIEFALLVTVVLALTATLERQDSRTRRAARSMRRENQIDPLTGVGNRRALNARQRQLDRTTEPVGVLAIDIDHFKDINDDFGHATGDSVLLELAELLRGLIRATDLVTRTGGEEFVVLLPSAKLANAVSLGETLRHQVAEHPFKALDGTGRNITVSVGCAARLGIGTLELVLDRADRALYAAKSAGRNRVLPSPDRRPVARHPLPGTARAEHEGCPATGTRPD